MKKFFTFIFAIALSFNMMAQCPLSTAVDFTATDCHGTEVHLFDILDGGQYVLMDFFFTTCGPCQQATPKVVESYYSFGCNMYDVYYIEVSVSDGDAACQTWAANYGVEYPTISTAGGGATICNSLYHIGQYPTVILIAPDHSIVIQDLWPINNAQTIINALTPYGIQQHDCSAPIYDPEVTITVDQVLENEVTATFTPNAECAEYHYMMATEAEIQQWMSMTGLELPEYISTYGFPGDEVISHTFDGLEPNTDYMIYAVPADASGTLYDVVQKSVTTSSGGGGDIIVDFTGTDIAGNEIHLYDILDAGQYVLINFFLAGDSYSQDIMGDMVEAYHMYGCNEHDVFFMEISPNGGDATCQNWVETYGVQYPTISRDGGGNDIAQAIPVGYYPTIMLIRPDHTFAQRDIYPPTLDMMVQYMTEEGIQQYECNDAVDENIVEKVTLYPNPANEFVKIGGENLGTVMVFNAIGQKVAEFVAVDEIEISTSGFENGVYFVKVGNTTQKFVVTH
ncbi:MAG: redoxin domain-containing protein [Bacteroidales bacterium]|nr:redoxin domain-containing protein [Bacteroidales bacterium]